MLKFSGFSIVFHYFISELGHGNEQVERKKFYSKRKWKIHLNFNKNCWSTVDLACGRIMKKKIREGFKIEIVKCWKN